MSDRVPSGCPRMPVDPDALAPAELAALDAHLESCAGCRSRAVQDDPSRLFADLGGDPVPIEVLDAVSASVDAALDDERRRARWRPAAALVAAALLAGALLAALTPRQGVALGPVAETLSVQAPGAHRADVQLTEPDGDVRVVDLTVGDRQVVMIFDGSLQL